MNAEHDRDRLLDQTLAKARGQDVPPPPGPACLDAETLAAWMDGGLDAGAVAMAEAHASSCARCQALVGAMAHATPAAAPAAEPHRSLWRWWLAPIAVAAAATTIWMVTPLAPAPAPSQVPMVRTVPGVPRGDVPGVPEVQGVPNVPREPVAPKLADGAATAGRAEYKLKAEAAGDASAIRERRDEARTAEAQAAAAPAALAAREAPQAPEAPKVSQAPIAILSPDPAIRWRIGTGGAVDYTPDGGGSWERIVTGVTSDLTAGAAPSPTVCWLVGRAGVVLLATDGRTLARVAFPDAADLVAVQATDARSATVTTADGRRFATDDGGRTWGLR